MIRRPPRSTRTDTLFPYTTLFRSARARPSSPHVRARDPYAPNHQYGVDPAASAMRLTGQRQRHNASAAEYTEAGHSRGLMNGGRGMRLCASRSFSPQERSAEPTSELQSLTRISYAVFCLIKK